jgi:hypothetical protein
MIRDHKIKVISNWGKETVYLCFEEPQKEIQLEPEQDFTFCETCYDKPISYYCPTGKGEVRIMEYVSYNCGGVYKVGKKE